MTQIVSAKFVYDGKSRIVDNIKWEFNANSNTLVGFELRKSGKFSYKIKRYDVDKIGIITYIDPPYRSGPVIGRAS
jgi:hypothetical protein